MRSSARTRLLLVVVPALLAGCCGRRRPATPVSPDARPAPPAVVHKPDSVRDSAKAVVTEPPKTAADSAAIAARADSVAKANRAGKVAIDSVTKKDSVKPTRGRPGPASKPCVLNSTESPPDTRMRFQRLPDSTTLTFVGGGFVAHCEGETGRIRSDSAEHFEASGILNLFGNVTYEDPGKVHLAAQHATYFTREERLIADGNVVATQLSSGSTFRGSSVEYLRPTTGRPFSKLIAPNRPTLQLIEKDSLGNPTPPVNVTANTIVDDADSLLFAWGDVQITRTTLLGQSDSASFDKGSERARLIRSARVVNNDDKQPFRMSGDTIDMYSRDRKLERVVALHNGNASSNDVVMQAERIDLRFVKQELERAYAFGTGRAKATTASQLLVADSIEVRMPEQRVRTVMAFGTAVATGTPDTTKIKSEDRDVLRGDTVKAWFDSTAIPADSSKRSKLTEIHALGNASSIFQIANKEGPLAPAALNYVRGKFIHILFDSGQVRDVLVDSSASGLYLEPVPDSLSDSTKGKRATPVKPKVPPAPAPRPPVGKFDPAFPSDSRRRQ